MFDWGEQLQVKDYLMDVTENLFVNRFSWYRSFMKLAAMIWFT